MFSACHVCVQGKAAATDQHVLPMANLVPKPQLMPNSYSQTGNKAAPAEKVKQLKLTSDKAGGNRDRAYGSLVSQTTEPEGQVKTSYNSHAPCPVPKHCYELP